jgi:membrane protein implicated in regulation of membrane protease activity
MDIPAAVPRWQGECMQGKGALLLMILGILAVIYGVVTFQWLLMLIIVAIIVIILLILGVLQRRRSGPHTPEQARLMHYEQSLESIHNNIRKL